VVFTGRLHPQKNLGLLLEAWPAVVRASGASLMLVGDGEERESLRARAAELGVANQVHFTGRVDDPSQYLRAADAFVLPSVAEGMSNSLLEAMATGLPCLASDIGGNTDLLGEGGAGWLLPGDDPEAWADAIIRVVTDRGLRFDLGSAARKRVEAEFSLEVVVDHYQSLYRIMLGSES
jgi:glycosyltransferase involved in cell wall biosynthesis